MDILQNIPLWFLPIIGSALLLGVYDLNKKHAVHSNAVVPVLFLATLSGTLFFVAAVLVKGQLAEVLFCGWRVWRLVLVKSLIVSSSWLFVYYSMRDLPISIASPFRASSPLWTFIGGMIFLGEIPSLPQFAAMIPVFAGCFLFNLAGAKEGFAWKSKSMLMLFAGTLLGAGSALYDKFLLGTLGIEHNMLQFHFSVDLVIVLGVALAVNFFRGGGSRKFQWRWSIPATGILLILADWLYFYAVSQPDVQIAVLSLVRRCNCVVAFTAGVWIFKDRNIKRKAIAMILILAGVILLAVTG